MFWSEDLKYRFSDLDNTILFSHRHDIGPKKVVEYLNGKEQAYIGNEEYKLLQMCNKEELIPITSRSIEQYSRIKLYDEGYPLYALVDNGANLLVNNVIQKEWNQKINEDIKDDVYQMKSICSDLQKYCEIKWQDEVILYAKNIIESDMSLIQSIVDENNLYMYAQGKKHYICSKKLTKGIAIKRFKDKFGERTSLAAGDSEVDVSMAFFVDYIFLSEDMRNDNTEKLSNVLFVEKRKLAKEILTK